MYHITVMLRCNNEFIYEIHLRCVLNKTQKNHMTKEEMVNMLLERNLAFNVVTDDGLASYRFATLTQGKKY